MAAGERAQPDMKSTLLKVVVGLAAVSGLAALLLCGLVLWWQLGDPAAAQSFPYGETLLFNLDLLTAGAFFLVVLGSLMARFRMTRMAGRIVAAIGGASGALPIIDHLRGTDLTALTGTVAGGAMSVATAEALLCFGLGSLFWLFRRYGLGQAACSVALLPSLGSLIGHLIGTTPMFGMVPIPVLLVTALTAITMLGGTAHRGSIRVFLSRTISGRFGRKQLLIATLVPIGLAVFFARLLPEGGEPLAVAETVASIVTIAWVTIGATALVGRRLDLQRHKAEAELRNLARHDGLTGLLNRRSMNKELPHAYAEARRNRHPITLMMCDLDHFKALNDKYGHGVGDSVLKRTAERISATVRDSDQVFRYGGEEIAVLLDCGPDDAVRIAEKIREAVKAGTRRAGDTDLPTVTISIGAATSERAQTELGRIMGAADECLYAAKDAGRDCVRHVALP
jgi:diguanylate cyclase (GGDEF)-like protein